MPVLVHGTAIVVGTTGLILIGPSGSGKSSIALQLIGSARRAGHFAALLSDDQVFLDEINGRLVATAPSAIRGLIELRCSGIGRVEMIDSALLMFALQPVPASPENRIPEENQRWSPFGDVTLPLFFIDSSTSDPFTRLEALLPGFPVSGTFQL